MSNTEDLRRAIYNYTFHSFPLEKLIKLILKTFDISASTFKEKLNEPYFTDLADMLVAYKFNRNDMTKDQLFALISTWAKNSKLVVPSVYRLNAWAGED